MSCIQDITLISISIWLILIELVKSFFNFPINFFKKPKVVDGKKVLITGAGSGVGRELAIQFSKLKAVLILWDINEKGLLETVQMCKECSKQPVYSYVVDLSSKERIYETAEKVKEVGDVDVIVNNAGVVSGKMFLDIPDNMIMKTFEVNSLAIIWTLKCFLPSMISRNEGHIVTVASLAGYVGSSYLTDYCGSKFAARGFIEALRADLRGLGANNIKTTTVNTFYINTGMFDGVRLRPYMKLMETDYACNMIINAIRYEKNILLLPKFFQIALIGKSFLPLPIFERVMDKIGMNEVMASFVGRKQKAN